MRRNDLRAQIACYSASVMFLVATMLFCGEIRAQESAGQAEVAMQGYYMSGSGQPLLETSGMAGSSNQFIEGLGLLSTNVEGYGGDGFRTGNLFAGLQGTPIWGWHWDFMGGDYHFSSYMVENPFSNVYSPEIAGRGAQIAMRRTNRTFQFFIGEDTVLEGPRIPFRLILPQRIVGASMQQKFGKRFAFGVRYLNLATSPSALTDGSTFILPGRTYEGSNSFTLQSNYRVTKYLKVYGETGYGTVSGFTPLTVGQKPFSVLFGPVLETDKFSVRANYVRQSTSYMPLLGYFAGDRKGPYVEGHYRPFGRVEFYGSASGYSNNLEKNPALPSFSSTGYTSGASFTLPWRVSAGGSLTTLKLTEVEPSQPAALPSNNSQINLTVSRPLWRQSLRFSLIDMKLNVNAQPQAQRFEEMEDTFNWKYFVFGGAVRLQNTQSSGQDLNSVFFRGSLQGNIKRISAYAYMEKGNDLVNKSVFSTNSVSSTVMGISTPLFDGWTLHFETFQNQLLTALNPENIFLYGSSNQGLNSQLAGFNQRSIYFKVSKRYSWGRQLEQGSTIEQYAASHAPLVGSVEGFVMEAAPGGPKPAPNVTIILDKGRTAISDSSGNYAFSDVPEGIHELALSMEQLPADYAPGPASVAHLNVQPRGVSRSDFDVVRLANLAGKIVAPKDVQIENVVVRLVGTKVYTTPYEDGTFSFYNLSEGHYEVEIDTTTLPEGYQLASPARIAVDASSTSSDTQVGFEIKIKPPVEKPVREMLKQEIHVTPPSSTSHH
ncbi:MAG: collagen binding domain-containing protein [Terracidiphilus sp.]